MAKSKSTKKVSNKKNRGKRKSNFVKTQQLNLLELAFVLFTGSYFLAHLTQISGAKSVIENNDLLNYIWLGAISLCSLLLIWKNKGKLNTEIPQSDKKSSFSEKYPRLNRISILNTFSKAIYNQGIWINIGLLTLCVLAAILYSYQLGFYNWLPDEPLVVKAAKGYLETGTFNKWDFWNDTMGTKDYSRAWPHTWLVAQSINMFGLSEVSARLVSVFCGVITVPILYFVSNFFLKNKTAALVITCCFIFHPYAVHYFRRTRMYAPMIPLFIVLFYVVFKAITEKKSYSNFIYRKFPKLNQYFNFHWTYVLLTFVLIYISFEVHKISIILFPGFFLFYLFLIIYKPEKKLFSLLLIAAIPAIYLITFENVWEKFLRKVGDIDKLNAGYWEYLFHYPISISFSVFMVLIAIIWAFLSKQRIRIIPIILLLIISIILFIYVIEYPAHYRYVIHIIPFSIMLCVGMLLKINSLLRFKLLKVILPVLLIASSISIFIQRFDFTYYGNREAEFPRKAYPTIIKNIKPEKEAIFALYFSDIYLQGMGKQIDLVKILNRRKYTLGKFKSDLRKYEGGWVTWATPKSNHINPDLLNYLYRNCQKLHGYNVDDTKTEVFYCKN